MSIYLDGVVDRDLLAKHVAEGNISRRPHPTLPLEILNYTAKAQYEQAWDDVTHACRGLIYDTYTYEVQARPFPKFHNLGEHDDADIPTRAPDRVDDKLDGSLGIIYPTPDGPAVATRGSFTSVQAIWATAWLRENHPDWTPPADLTVLCEIIYPENRIVVDYGPRAELVGLAALDLYTGADRPLDWPGACTAVYDLVDLDACLAVANARANAEGFVCVWHQPDRPSLRIKIKADEYVRLHRAITGLSNRTVWEHMAAGTLAALIDTVPDEFHRWIDDTATSLGQLHASIATTAVGELDRAIDDAGGLGAERRVLAEHIKATTFPGLCFGLLDGKDIAPKVWRMVKPDREAPMIDAGEDI